MAKKHYYAVRKGRTPGIYKSWEECSVQIDKFHGAEYKGFSELKEAENYMNGADAEKISEADIIAYVDGSYDERLNIYGCGIILIHKNGTVQKFSKAGNNQAAARLRNVSGEMLGAMYAVRMAIRQGCRSIRICYDYMGIEMWATGAWKAKNELTARYAHSMQDWQDEIDISFQKVDAHTGVLYNEMADGLARQAVYNF